MGSLFSWFGWSCCTGLLDFLLCLLLVGFRLLCFCLIVFCVLFRICGSIVSPVVFRLAGWCPRGGCKCWNHADDRIGERERLEIHGCRILVAKGGCGCLFRGSFDWISWGSPSDLDGICSGFILSLLGLIQIRFLIGLVLHLLFFLLFVFILSYSVALDFQDLSLWLILCFITRYK